MPESIHDGKDMMTAIQKFWAESFCLFAKRKCRFGWRWQAVIQRLQLGGADRSRQMIKSTFFNSQFAECDLC